MGRVKDVPTPADSNRVMKTEQCIAAYRADLSTLKHALEMMAAAKDLLKEETAPAVASAAVHHCTCRDGPRANSQYGDSAQTLPRPVKVIFGKTADIFLATFVSKYIADKGDRGSRVATMKAILESWTP